MLDFFPPVVTVQEMDSKYHQEIQVTNVEINIVAPLKSWALLIYEKFELEMFSSRETHIPGECRHLLYGEITNKCPSQFFLNTSRVRHLQICEQQVPF